MESNSSSAIDQNPWLSDYMNFISITGDQIIYECKQCLPKKITIKNHISNLKRIKEHIKRVHDGTSPSSSKSSAKRVRQMSIGESYGIAATGSAVSQAEVDKCVVNLFVSNMIPLHVVDSESFATLIKTLNPSKNSISRRTLGRHIIDEHNRLKQHLISLLGKINWVAKTVDCWSAHHKSYLGMTAHWIDPITKERMHAVLSCKILRGQLTFDVLLQAMWEIDSEFNIQGKTNWITTDNGSNFVKEFVQIGIESDTLTNRALCDLESETDNNIDNLLSSSSDDEDLEFVSVENLLYRPDRNLSNKTNADVLAGLNCSPVHMRCAAHTFNLVASKDADAALQKNDFKTSYRSAIDKARALWNQQSRSTVAADCICAELGSQLVLPNTTRWKSLHDAIVILNGILEVKRPSLDKVMDQLNIPIFNDQDVTLMQEYVKVMAPVACALDHIQGEAQAYLGSLLPTIAATVFKLKSIKSKGLVHCKDLVNALLRGIERRFGPLMDDERCQLAAGFHPKFRLIWLEKYDNDKSRVYDVKQCMQREVEKALQEEAIEISKNVESVSGDDFINSFTQSSEKPKNRKSFRGKAQSLVKTWLHLKSKDSLNEAAFLGEQVLANLFIKYNIAIPSSAAVERFFSKGNHILKLKGASLSDENFNMLMFMNGNNHIRIHD